MWYRFTYYKYGSIRGCDEGVSYNVYDIYGTYNDNFEQWNKMFEKLATTHHSHDETLFEISWNITDSEKDILLKYNYIKSPINITKIDNIFKTYDDVRLLIKNIEKGIFPY